MMMRSGPIQSCDPWVQGQSSALCALKGMLHPGRLIDSISLHRAKTGSNLMGIEKLTLPSGREILLRE